MSAVQTLAAILLPTILAFAPAALPQAARPNAWVIERGYIVAPDQLELFGAGDKEFQLSNDHQGWGWEWQLCFADDAVYREVERHSGLAVQVRGRWVSRGSREWFLVEEVQATKPQ